MIGVITSGGQSQRMGMDKGLILRETQHWVQQAMRTMQFVVNKSVVSINPGQFEAYSKLIDPKFLVTDSESLHLKGPLHGLLSVHNQFPDEDQMVLASDMVAMDVVVLEKLKTEFENNPGHPCYVFRDENGYQPLVGVYSAALLAETKKDLLQGRLLKFSMKHLLEMVNPFVINVPPTWQSYFVNYNYKEDIDFQ